MTLCSRIVRLVSALALPLLFPIAVSAQQPAPTGSIAGRVVRGAWLANWMVDPDQRQFGLGLLLMRQIMSEFEVALTVGANQLARDLFTRST